MSGHRRLIILSTDKSPSHAYLAYGGSRRGQGKGAVGGGRGRGQ